MPSLGRVSEGGCRQAVKLLPYYVKSESAAARKFPCVPTTQLCTHPTIPLCSSFTHLSLHILSGSARHSRTPSHCENYDRIRSSFSFPSSRTTLSSLRSRSCVCDSSFRRLLVRKQQSSELYSSQNLRKQKENGTQEGRQGGEGPPG